MAKTKFQTFAKLAFVLILVYFFLVSIGLMETAFKGFGKAFAENLIGTTSNPFVGLFIGILATSLIQSSSTTTSIVVGMVGGGVLTVSSAVPIVMGANIGTTVTNTLVSLGHINRREEFKRAIAGATIHDFFNLICVAIMFPLELATGFLQRSATLLASLFTDVGGIKFTSPIKTATKPAIHLIHDVLSELFPLPQKAIYILMLILSMVILFFCLFFIVKTMRTIIAKGAESVIDNIIGKQGLLVIAAGFFFTVLVQSSSITTSLMIPLVAAGILTVEAAFPLTMGANIGTTTTAILASFATGNVSAIIIAFVHFLFNTIGVICIYPISIFRKIPIRLAKGLGELAFRKRWYALIYVLSVFFLIPALLILASKFFT
jgi:sodium-dependent phosphate cotransporter